ncbi:MAG: ABC transporter ATP-binding protein [Solirubrobacterales bacterium]
MMFETRAGPQLVLDEIALSVGPGEFVAIIGPSGCGKSTLLKLLAGLLEPSAGMVKVGGLTAREAIRRRQIGVVFQEPTLLPWLRAAANVELLAQLSGRSGRSVAEHAREMLGLVGLANAADKYPAELSGGMAQRISIARALVLDPSTLLMDEPFGALDAITRERMNQTLLGIWARTRKTILFVTHAISEAVLLSDRVLVMASQPGRIVERLEIDLPRPRDLETLTHPRFKEYERHLRELLVSSHDDDEEAWR